MKQIYFLVFFLLSVGTVAQEKTHSFSYKNILLPDFIIEVEQAFDVKFSYNSTALNKVNISINSNEATLNQLILEIEAQTHLTFLKINSRYYTIKVSKNLTFCGYIKDAVTNDPLEGTTISTHAMAKGVISDGEGYFNLKNIAVSDTVSISFLGYKTIVLPLKSIFQKKCNSYLLSRQEFTLDEVVVKEYLASGIVKMNDGAVQITPANLDILSGLSEPDVLQNIQLLPGIESPSETASGIFIRGGTPDQNLVLWDGVKMYNSHHFFGMLSAFNPYITKDVKVYRSGTKAEYGDRVSGVIDINTDEVVPEKTSAGLGFNMINADVYIKQPITKDFGILFSARRSITDLIDTFTFNEFSNTVFQNTNISDNQMGFNPDFLESKEQFYFTDLTLKLIANISKKDRITISNIVTQNKLDYSFEDTRDGELSSDKLNIKNLGSNTTWSRNWSRNFNTKTQFYFSEYDLEYSGIRSFFNNDLSAKENNIQEVGFSFQGDWILNKNLTFSSGYQFYDNKVSYVLDQENDIISNKTHAAFSQLTYDDSKNWHIDFGIRMNYFSTIENTFLEPRLYVEHKISNNFRFKASAEAKNQSISQIIEFTSFDLGLENQIWTLADDQQFPILNSSHFSGGLLFHTNGWNLDIEAYTKKVNGLTSFTNGFLLSSVTFSKGNSITNGIDVLLKKKIHNYSTWLGYTYSKTNFTFDNLNNGTSFLGNNDITNSITWSHFYSLNKLQFSMGWKYRTGIPFTEALGISNNEDLITYGTLNGNRLKDYHRLDFSVVYDFNLSKQTNSIKARAGLSLLNLYNQRNTLSKSYIVTETIDSENNVTKELTEINRFSLGRTPNIFFRLNF